MIDKYTLPKDNDKSFAHSQKFITPVQQVLIECQYVDKLQSLLDYCNRHILKNFQLDLVMENDNLETKEKGLKLK